MGKKQELESKKAAEQASFKAALNIRRVIAKVKCATPQSLEVLKAELDAVMAQDLENAGSQKQLILNEVAAALEQAKKNIELEEKRKADLEERKKMMEDNKK